MENENVISGQLIIMIGFWSGVLGYPILQFFAIKRMQGGWRVLAFLPLILMAIVFFITVVLFFQQSNLWPIILIFVAPLILVYLAVLLGVHWFVVRGKNVQKQIK